MVHQAKIPRANDIEHFRMANEYGARDRYHPYLHLELQLINHYGESCVRIQDAKNIGYGCDDSLALLCQQVFIEKLNLNLLAVMIARAFYDGSPRSIPSSNSAGRHNFPSIS